MLSRFHLIPERYGQMDRQTDRQMDRQTDLLYQYRISAHRRVIKMRLFLEQCNVFGWETAFPNDINNSNRCQQQSNLDGPGDSPSQ